MSTTIIRPKDREAWLQGRKQGIGSSEVGTILGLNPFETPYQLWRRKRGMDAPVEENEAMLMGHLLEDAVATRWAMATGNEIIKRSAVDWIIVNNERDYLRVSPDRTYWLQGMPKNDKNKGILECKTTMMKIDEDDIPQHWFCQLQYQLGVAELNEGALAWLVQGRQFNYKPLRFDAEFYAFIVEEVERFWRDNIIGGVEPLSINVEDVMLKNPRHTEGKQVTATADVLELVARLRQLKADAAEQAKEAKELEAELKMTIGDAEALVTEDGKTLATWKASKDTRKFDEKAFAAANPTLHDEYMRDVAGTRRFLLK